MLLVLQACVVAPQRSDRVVESVGSAVAGHGAELDSLLEGDTVMFDTGLLAPLGQVTIGREYHSASGRMCKRILNASGNELVSVACKVQKGHWYMRELLSARPANVKHRVQKSAVSGSDLLVPEMQRQGNGADEFEVTGDEFSYTLEQDETLWSFSRRTTGNALNWKAIAQYNGVDVVSTLEAGRSLVIPSALHRNGR